jgi:hypothetical protein
MEDVLDVEHLDHRRLERLEKARRATAVQRELARQLELERESAEIAASAKRAGKLAERDSTSSAVVIRQKRGSLSVTRAERLSDYPQRESARLFLDQRFGLFVS